MMKFDYFYGLMVTYVDVADEERRRTAIYFIPCIVGYSHS